MLKKLKITGLIPKRPVNTRVLLLLIIMAEVLVLGWLTWLIFQNNPITGI
ncbi:MAG TPA: hypothetical protein VK808_08095 [Bacteroidia bacterium]|jgi:hypothetical protein|nr:hypothetical protein [Bacteroidia bacterium]